MRSRDESIIMTEPKKYDIIPSTAVPPIVRGDGMQGIIDSNTTLKL